MIIYLEMKEAFYIWAYFTIQTRDMQLRKKMAFLGGGDLKLQLIRLEIKITRDKMYIENSHIK